MKIDKRIVIASGRAGLLLGILWWVLFAVTQAVLPSNLDSAYLGLYQIISARFYEILYLVAVGGLVSVLFGAVYNYVPTKKAITKFLLFICAIVAIIFAFSALLNIDKLLGSMTTKVLFYSILVLSSTILFDYAFERFYKKQPVAVETQRTVSFKKRFAAFVIDVVFLAVIIAIPLYSLIVPAIATGIETAQKELPGIILPAYVFWSLYWPVTEWCFGKTLGKKVIGIKVATEGNSRISATKAIARNVTKMIIPTGGILFLAIDYIVLIKAKQKVFDLIAGTTVTGMEKRAQTRERELIWNPSSG